MKTIYTLLLTLIISSTVTAQSYYSLSELRLQKQAAIDNKQYRLLERIDKEIDKREVNAGSVDISTPTNIDPKMIALEKKQKEAVAAEDWILADKIKNERLGINTEVTPATDPDGTVSIKPILTEPIPTPSSPTNMREKVWQAMKKLDYATANKVAPSIKKNAPEFTDVVTVTKLKKTEANTVAKDLKYRRSSLYTLMVNDNTREHANIIYDAFGNAEIPTKFNDHNIGPYLIKGQGGEKKEDAQIENINQYIETEKVANALIAKWFNRDAEGKFNMNLIAKRGMYDASVLDVHIAGQTERGTAMLADAGEELIKKTFVIINDYKYTNKEEVVAKAKKVSGFAKMAAAYVPGGSTVTNTLDVAETTATIAGKGYVVKTISYLYQLVWDEETAANFYYKYWTDKNNFDPSKVEAFNNSNDFKLKFVGYQSAWADVQSSIFSDKGNDDLIKIATVKATDKAMAKLAVKYEEFRTKTPLFSGDPIAAKIGTKEGLKKGNKFEVLEQVLGEDGKTQYKRKGIVKVDKVWDNSLNAEEIDELKKQGKLTGNQFTTFKGGGNYYPGMLIKQIK